MTDLPHADARALALRGPLLAELRRPRRAVTPLRGALAAAAVLVAVAGAAALNDAQPALAVDREDGRLVLRIADVAAGEEAMTRELRDAGIRGEVRLLPVAPEDVGTWVVISEAAGSPGPRETVRLSRVEFERETLRIPIAEVRESTGSFVFYAGREARPGEELRRDGRRRFRE